MPNPLAIFGALTQLGAAGAGGAYQGAVEAPFAKQQLQTGDIENQLRMLRGAALQQEIQQRGQPNVEIAHGFKITRAFPGGPILGMERLPLSDVDRARIGEYESLAALHRGQLGQVGKEKPAPPQRPESETQLWASIGEKIANGTATEVEKSMWASHQKTVGGAAGKRPVVVRGALVDPETGKVIYQAPVRPGAGLTPRETVTTTTKITPRKEITNADEVAKISQALPSVVNEIAANPAIEGWMQPGAFVRIQGYPAPVRREDVIARAMLKKAGIGVSVQWDGKQWKLVRAWLPEQKEPMESRRTTGPPRQQQADTEDEE